MINLDLNKELKNLAGSAYPESMSEIVAGHLFMLKSKHPLKMCDWALKLFSDSTLSLDSEDIRLFCSTIEKLEIPSGIIGQILKEINNQKDQASA